MALITVISLPHTIQKHHHHFQSEAWLVICKHFKKNNSHHIGRGGARQWCLLLLYINETPVCLINTTIHYKSVQYSWFHCSVARAPHIEKEAKHGPTFTFGQIMRGTLLCARYSLIMRIKKQHYLCSLTSLSNYS